MGLVSASDEEQLAFAREQGHVIMTHDEDFLILHSQEVPHAGLAYCPPDTPPIGHIMQALLLIWGVMEPEEMANHVEFL